MSNIVSFEDFKKKNKANLPVEENKNMGSSQVVSFQDFKVRNNAQNFLKNSAQAKFYNYLTQPKQVETAQDKRNTWFNTGAKGNILQKTAGTVGDIGLNVVKGIAGAGEKLGDLASYGVAGVADVLGAKDYAQSVREAAQANLVGNTLQPVTNQVNQYSILGDKIDSIVQSVGESYAMAKVGGALSKTGVAQKAGLGDALNKQVKLGKLNINIPLMSVLTGASSGITEAYQKGGNNQQAFIRGITSGLAEGISEGIFGVFGQGGSSFEQEVMYKATKKIENDLARRLTKKAITAFGEGAEEGISYAFNYVADNLQDIINTSLGKEINKMGDKWDWKEFGENILSGTIAGGISTGAETLGNTLFNGKGAAILESTQHQVENKLNRALTDAELVTLEDVTRNQLKNGKINVDEIVNRIQNPTVEDLVAQDNIKQNTTPQLDTGLQQTLSSRYTTDTSNYTGTQLQTYQNAINSGLLNNNKNTHDFVDFVSKISKDKGIVFNFTNNQALQDRNINAQINGYIDNNGITLNIDSNLALEKVIGHEITHTLENMVNEYESLKNSFKQLLGEEEFNTRLEQIKELYKGIEGANYENELISDLAGEYLFTNEDFINRLSTEKPSLFKRIYQEIKYLWKMATGTEQEKQLARTMRIYEQAYRNAGKVTTYQTDNFAQKAQNAQETQTTPQETKPEIKKYPNLTEEEAKEYEFLDSLPFDLTGEDLQTYERLQRKMEGKPNLPTRKDIQFKDIARDYGKYKDLEGYNAELTKDAESLVPDRQGRRTKEQWLDVASFIGERFKGTDEQLKKYAIQSWLAERPNNKDRLNRQGKGYVKFTIEEWLNKIYESANRTKPITQYSLSENYTSEEKKMIDYFEQYRKKENTPMINQDLMWDSYNENTPFDEKEYYKTIEKYLKDYRNNDPHNGGTFNGENFWSGSVSLIDGVIEEVHTYEDAHDADFNHSMYFSPTQVDKMDEGENAFFWVEDGKINGVWREEIPQNIINKIEEQIQIRKPSTQYSLSNKNNKYPQWINDIADNEPQYKYKNYLQDLASQKEKETGYRIFSINGQWKYMEKGDATTIKNIDAKDTKELAQKIYDLPKSERLTHDNQGRGLTEEQQEFFKDSKVRDEEGRLLEVYHGTPNPGFTIFDTNKSSSNTSTGDYGLYFTDSQKFADDFSYERLESGSMFYDIKGKKGDVYKAYLNMINPLDFSKLTKSDFANLYDNYISSMAKQITTKEQYIDNMTKWQQEYGNHQMMKGYVDLKKLANSSEYDGVIARLDTFANNDDSLEYIVFNSNQIKNIDNTNPTSNPDIRYSLSQDNQGRQLTEEQQEYFKDSKIRDKDGKLKTVYHGTSKDFTVFDWDKIGSNTHNEGILGKGFYFTNYKKLADNYNRDMFGNVNKVQNVGKTMEGYINITNPFVWQSIKTKDEMEQFAQQINAPKSLLKWNPYSNGGEIHVFTEVKDSRKFTELLKKQGYDGVVYNYSDEMMELSDKYGTAGTQTQEIVAFNSNQFKNVDNLNPTESDDIRYQLSQKQKNLPKGQFKGKSVARDINLPTTQENALNVPLNRQKKVLNPTEISNLTEQDANTTPILPTTRTLTGDKQSRFLNNLNTTQMLTQESKNVINNAKIGDYKSVTNEESLRDASEKLSKGGKAETERWFRNDPKNVNATDIAEGFILLNQYQTIAKNSNNAADKYQANQSMVEVAKKLRQIGTEAGQTLQAYSILSRMTPEGMVYYAQSELTDAYNEMVKNKSKEWINQNRSNFELTPEETQFILDTMNEVSTMEDGYEKKVKLAEIQKLMTDKLPPAKGQKIKSWMRLSMLFNPKTQVRNVAGNTLIVPVNSFSDIFASYADKLISRKTGKRTTGTTNIKAMLEGFKKGAYEATTDYKKGINTRDIEGNRFEIGDGKSFSDKSIIGKALNNTESLLNYVMDAGDRVFSEAAFENSLQNQLKLNNTNEITQDMIDIARQEALSRTWNDNNNYTQFVLNVRSMLNKVNFGTYGLGDVLIPFAKTPANLTKAIVDYSPVGFVNTLLKGQKLSRSLENGQYTPQLQHDFVQTLGKATAGTMLYVLGMALAKAGITSGESDEDKDTQNFLKNTLGISNYSIKLGGKSFTYDWAQPIAAPLSITANIANRKDKEQALGEAIISNLDTASSVLLEQSFMQGINEVLNGNGGIVDGMIKQVLELPARAVPTLSKQIVDLTDSTQRTSYEYNKPVESAINAVKAKIPGLSQTLAPVVDTMGREVQRYGGKNNLFNVFLNPANVNTENISEAASEIYEVYKATGDKTIMPRVAPYYINQKGEKITLNSKQKAQFQTISGSIIEENMNDLINNQAYQNLNDTEKASMINNLVNYAYNKARKDVLGIDMSNEYNKINEFVKDGGTPAEYYTNKEEINYAYTNPEKYSAIRQITTYNMYQTYNNTIKDIKTKYSTSDERKSAIINYVNGLELGIPQKAMLIRMNYSSFKQYDNQIIQYINSQDLTVEQKSAILKEIGFTIKNGVVYN